MRRVLCFWRAVPLSAKFQYFAMALIVGYAFYMKDMHPRNKLFGVPLWQVSGPMILGTIIIGRMLLPLMMMNPARAQRTLQWFGRFVFVMWIFSIFQQRRLIISYQAMSGVIWLEVSCWFWFIS